MFINRFFQRGTCFLSLVFPIGTWFGFVLLVDSSGYAQTDRLTGLTQFGLLVAPQAQIDDENQVTLQQEKPRFETGRAVFKQQAATSLELRLIRGAYAVFRAADKREAVGVGDRFGQENYLVLAVREDRIFFQSGGGFGLIYRNQAGETILELINRAVLPPDILELAPKPQ